MRTIGALGVAVLFCALACARLDADDTKFDLSWKPEPKTKIVVTMDSIQKREMNVAANVEQNGQKEDMEQETEGETKIRIEWTDEVQDVEEKRVQRTRREFTSVAVTTKNRTVQNGQEVPDEKGDEEADLLDLDGKTLTLERDGKETAVSGADAEKVSDAAKNWQKLDPAYLALLPKEPVGVGESWTSEGETP